MINEVIKGLIWLGQSGFVINAEQKTVTIDPYQSKGYALSDIILITHPHGDHLSLEDIERCRKSKTVIITEAHSAKKLSGDVRIIKPGEEMTIEDIKIKAVVAYNINDDSPHQKKNDWLGFIIDIDGVSIYHSGDTDLIPEMDNFDVDIALLPVSGTYVMNAEEAIKAVKRIKPKIAAVPMHYDPNLTRHWKIFPGVGTKEDALNGIDGICQPVLLPCSPEGY
tara:strand:- start:432 stop:1100 length:669 start_codon:yes stop_codon:yes gene_type:complete